MTTTLESHKRKRVSKKKKSSWRKHAKVQDVEQFLEDKRLDERFGLTSSDGSKIDSAFVVDTKKEVVVSSKRQRRIQFALKPIKCFEHLEARSSVPDPVIKRNRVRTKEERRHPIAKKKDEQRKLQGILKHKEILAKKNRNLNRLKKKLSKPKLGVFNKDIWDVENIPDVDKDPEKEYVMSNEWLENNTIRHTLINNGKRYKGVPKSVHKKPSVVPPIELPHPGISYNPSLRDHQELLSVVAEKEQKELKKEAHLKRVTTDLFSKVTPGKREKSWISEMSEGLPINKNKKDVQSDNDSDDNEYSTVNPPVENKKKDLKQRRKQKEQILLERARQKVKLEKKKLTDIRKLEIIKNQLSKQEKKQKYLKEKREKVKAIKSKEPKKLGANKFEEPSVEFNMKEDIAGNLRNLKTEGNLLLDRFKSLQKRNILQVSKIQMKKKAKVKKFERANYKMGWEPKGYKK